MLRVSVGSISGEWQHSRLAAGLQPRRDTLSAAIIISSALQTNLPELSHQTAASSQTHREESNRHIRLIHTMAKNIVVRSGVGAGLPEYS